MKILILSCVMGEGHNSAAKALLEYFVNQGDTCEMVDTLSLISQTASKGAADLYVFSTKSHLFENVYVIGDFVSRNSPIKKSPIYYGNIIYCSKLKHYITSNGFDAVIATHIFPMEALTALQRLDAIHCKTLGVMTDYTCIPFMEETDVDYYTVPHPDLVDECVRRGMKRDKLFPFGIPVKHTFYHQENKLEAKKQLQTRYNLQDRLDKYWFLIMSGGMGFGNLSEIVEEVEHKIEDNVQLFVVCGNNQALYDALNLRFLHYSNIVLMGFTNEISLFMDACDVIFTKPGGLSSTEAAVKNIPIIHTAPIPGCETKNAHFFADHGMSFYSDLAVEQVNAAINLCRHPTLYHQMQEHQRDNCDYHTAEEVRALLTDSYENRVPNSEEHISKRLRSSLITKLHNTLKRL